MEARLSEVIRRKKRRHNCKSRLRKKIPFRKTVVKTCRKSQKVAKLITQKFKNASRNLNNITL